MYNHAPQAYDCPICIAIKGIESEETMIRKADIVYRDDSVLALINSKFIGNNPGHVIVVPVEHFENLYDLPPAVGARIMAVAQKMALAIKEARKCDGIWIEQNNEPAAGQHAFHYHMHVVPRFIDDGLRSQLAQGNIVVSQPEERVSYAEALRAVLKP